MYYEYQKVKSIDETMWIKEVKEDVVNIDARIINNKVHINVDSEPTQFEDESSKDRNPGPEIYHYGGNEEEFYDYWIH